VTATDALAAANPLASAVPMPLDARLSEPLCLLISTWFDLC